ncbi:hypothetical protein GA0070607_1533 [Micromonospora coriariae]|uniref:Uncharacterized protein n=1 Tax=Micromonospora coriariae TaxID=285665 RepID=A0A1C4V3R0_9ACTN|nr:hypothetical protein [Micromonospora coriariae]SCE78425.1 hypothetical protein GA0070607_1533 [Micromonospora coriariae]
MHVVRDDGELPAGQDGSGRRWLGRTRLVLVLCGAVVAVVAATAGVRWFVGEPDPAAGGKRSIGYGCPVFGSDPGPPKECGPPAALDPRRAPVTEGQRTAVRDRARAIRLAASHAGWCMTGAQPECARQPASHEPTQHDVDAARLWLSRTEASASTARLARPGDPGHVGGLLYAARLDDVCVIGHFEQVPSGVSGEEIVGLLPDGTCLPD